MPFGALHAVVFDLDGTILDSERPIHDAWRWAYAQHGASFTPAEWASTVGTVDGNRGVFDPAGQLVARADRPVDLDRVLDDVRERSRTSIPTEPLPGVRELVAALQSADVRIGVATAANRWWPDLHLTRLGLADAFGDDVSGRDDVGGKGKPDPAVFERTMSLLGVPPTNTVAVEDSVNGVAAARAAGCRVLAVPNPLIADQVRAAGPDAVAESLLDVTPERLAALLD